MYTAEQLESLRQAGGDHWLMDCAASVHSQFGEDGILAAALSVLPQKHSNCVEFGAWDGRHLSNTYRLIKEEEYSAFLIEGDEAKYRQLCENFKANDRVKPHHAFVGWEAENSLDTLLPEWLPLDFDLLSIDIDGNDYHVWEAMTTFRPKLVIVEFNPTIPTEVDFVQEPSSQVAQGASLKALCRLASAKGYDLIATTLANALFVDRDYYPRYGIQDNSPSHLRRDTSQITHLFCGFDGTVFLSGNKTLPWHGVPYQERKMQSLPSWCRRPPAHYSRLQRLYWKLRRHVRAA